jgi:hypothetical protein
MAVRLSPTQATRIRLLLGDADIFGVSEFAEMNTARENTRRRITTVANASSVVLLFVFVPPVAECRLR